MSLRQRILSLDAHVWCMMNWWCCVLRCKWIYSSWILAEIAITSMICVYIVSNNGDIRWGSDRFDFIFIYLERWLYVVATIAPQSLQREGTKLPLADLSIARKSSWDLLQTRGRSLSILKKHPLSLFHVETRALAAILITMCCGARSCSSSRMIHNIIVSKQWCVAAYAHI